MTFLTNQEICRKNINSFWFKSNENVDHLILSQVVALFLFDAKL